MKDMKETGVQSRAKEHKHYERQEYRAERRGTNTMKDMTEQREGAQTL